MLLIAGQFFERHSQEVVQLLKVVKCSRKEGKFVDILWLTCCGEYWNYCCIALCISVTLPF